MQYAIGVITALLFAYFYSKTKRNSDEDLKQNIDVKTEVNSLESKVIAGLAGIAADETKQKELADAIKGVENGNVQQTVTNISDFLNNRK